MTSERWRRIEELYNRACDQEASARAAFLAVECGADEALRKEVESLVAAGDDARGYLETPALELAARSHATDEARSNLAGTTVSHYRVLERLGEKVHRAEDTRLWRAVALKFFPELAGDPTARERFERQARAASAISHPNICIIYDIDESAGTPFVVLEFLEGVSLQQRIGGKAMPVDQLVDLALQIADGLEAAHTRGVLHLGLAFSRLFITPKGQVKILGIGLPVPATEAACSPEQARGEALDARSDLFSFGAVLYEMATGQAAFEGHQSTSVLNHAPVPVRQLRPSLPQKLEDAIAKALEKDRDVRYQHVGDLRADLKRLKRELDSSRIGGEASARRTYHPERLGRYRITGTLGVGGMGAVYKGLDPVIGREVAIKTILEDRLGSPEEAAKMREILKREARAAGSLAHPNIVTVFDAGEEEGLTYIVMEFIHGSTLDQLLPAEGTLGAERALEILGEAAAALDFAHSHGVVHRDVKPANIMIQEEGTAKLTDFGIARRVTASTGTLTGMIGTPRFMAPEQFRGQDASAESDQYSLAVVAWILLTGSNLFEEAGLMPLISKVLSQEPPAHSAISSGADRVLRRALAKDPAQRFESCGSFVAALREAFVGKRADVTPNPSNRRRWILGAGAVAACLLATAGGAWWLHTRSGASQPAAIASAPVAAPILAQANPDASTVAKAPSSAAIAPAGSKSANPVAGVSAGVNAASDSKQLPLVTGQAVDEAPAIAATPEASNTKAPKKEAPTKRPPAERKPGEMKINLQDGLTYVWIPPGTFQMGCSPGDDACQDDEKPAHQVTISKGFWIGQTEVTQEAYQKVVGKNPSRERGPKLPVGGLTWADARSYCVSVGSRLPTEAEWEYAARAGSTTSRYGELDQIAWFGRNSGAKTHEVAGKRPNAWRLYDTLGNVWEWVFDWFAPYGDGPEVDPRGPATGEFHVRRGGAVGSLAGLERVSLRGGNVGAVIGARCAGN
jgi:serine/threonine protein kinase/formylglycine-generating enzyme required for sulfatase activity